MILSFKCKRTEKLFLRVAVAPEWKDMSAVALRKLSYLHAARKLQDLLVPPGNRLEKLKGNRRENYSIRVNNKWRICFKFEEGNATEVEIVDYH